MAENEEPRPPVVLPWRLYSKCEDVDSSPEVTLAFDEPPTREQIAGRIGRIEIADDGEHHFDPDDDEALPEVTVTLEKWGDAIASIDVSKEVADMFEVGRTYLVSIDPTPIIEQATEETSK